jgi:hypothetical protein
MFEKIVVVTKIGEYREKDVHTNHIFWERFEEFFIGT